MKKVTIGIDVGGTNTKIGIVDGEGNCLNEASFLTQDKNKTIDEFISRLHKTVLELTEGISKKVDIQGIGIGAPNGNYYNGTIEFAPNLKWKGILPIVDLLKEKFDYKVIALTNDANAAAIGEMIYGVARYMNNFIVITLGTGLGSGIVVNGDLVYGNDGFAGELGHTTIEYNVGRKCGCGRRGCLETYVSATGIVRTVFELMAETQMPSELRNVPFTELTAKMISDAALNGDGIAKQAFEFTGKMLGRALADSVAILSPEAIVLFGGLAKAGELIFEPTKKHMEKNLMSIFKNKVKIIPSGMNSVANAAVLGASALAWKELSKI